jgi:hypothetical protein
MKVKWKNTMCAMQALNQAKLNLITSVVLGDRVIGEHPPVIREQDAQAISAALRGGVHLRTLQINCRINSSKNLQIILNALRTNIMLTSIFLGVLSIDNLDCTVITQALKESTSLKSVKLCILRTIQRDLLVIANFLKANRSLETFHLYVPSGHSARKGTASIMRAVASNTALRSFYVLSGDFFSSVDAGREARAVANILRNNTVLQSLGFTRVAVFDRLEANIIAAAVRMNETLHSISFEGVFKAGAALMIINALRVNTSLQTVSLRTCYFDDACVEEIAQVLRVNASITELDLSKNSFVETGMESLCSALHENKTLKTLNFSSSDITEPSSIEALGLMLKNNNSLTALNSSRCNLAPISALAEGLKVNASLKVIDLSACNLNHADMELMASVLRVNRALTSVKLCHSWLSVQNMRDFENALQENLICTTLTVMPWDYKEEEGNTQFRVLNQRLERNRRRGQFVTSPHGLKNAVLYSLFSKPLTVPDASQIIPRMIKLRLTECAMLLKCLDENILGRAIFAGYCVEPRTTPIPLPTIELY